jgi:hypothetical protein
MTITLLCPNGHKLVCPETQAGKRGKCPQCGATFRVPDLSSSSVGSSASSSGSSLPMISGSGSSPRSPAPVPVPIAVPGSEATSAVGQAAQPQPILQPQVAPEPAPAIRPYADGDAVNEDELIFLCPNGHQLCGPATLGGNAGQCPLCFVQFLVPSDEEPVEQVAPSSGGNGSPFDFDQQQAAGHPGEQTAADQGNSEMVESNNDANGLADLFDSFWAYKAHGATVEVHLESGQVIAPGGYAPHLSRGSHAVFMVRDANGLHTMSAVRWASISHIAVRGLRQLPDGVFDDH